MSNNGPDVPHGGTPARIISNVLTLGTGQVFTWAATAGLVILLPTQLGDTNLGKLSTAMSVTDFATLIAVLGVTTYLTREVARKGSGGADDVLNALAMRLPLTVAASVAAVAAAHLLGYDATTRALVYLLCLNIVASGVSAVLLGALHGLQAMRVVAFANAVSKLAMVAMVAAFLWSGYGVIAVAVAWNISSALLVVICAGALWRRRFLRGRIDMTLWRGLALASMPFFVWQAALLCYGQVDVVLLSVLTRAEVVGWYAAAYRIVSIPVFIPVIITAAIYPSLSRFSIDDRARFVELARRSLNAVVLATMPVALGVSVIAPQLLDALRYPDEFDRSIPLIVILALHIPVMGADMIIGSVLTSTGRERAWAFTAVGAALLNPTLNLGFIPWTERAFDNGAIGAASATLLTEIFMMGAGLALIQGKVFGRETAWFAARVISSGVIMTGAIMLVSPGGLMTMIPAGVLSYLVASFALRTISVDDVRLARTYLRQRVAAIPAPA